MGQKLRIEDPEMTCLITSRTRQSELWFVNNNPLHNEACAWLAKYQQLHGVILYAAVFVGNHFHLVARYPRANRAAFMRDFKARWARLLRSHCPNWGGGTLWGRRYSDEALPLAPDIENKFFYCALQAVNSGLASKISQYPGYNSFHDASSDTTRQYTLFDRTAFYRARLRHPGIGAENFYRTYNLVFTRLPGYEELSRKRYRALLLSELEKRRLDAIAKRNADGKTFLSPAQLLRTIPGSRPHRTKTSRRNSRRPIVITCCPVTHHEYTSRYFATKAQHALASYRFRSGEFGIAFPPGTYRPPLIQRI